MRKFLFKICRLIQTRCPVIGNLHRIFRHKICYTLCKCVEHKPPMTKKSKILIAEDFEPSLRIMREIIKALGYDFKTASNGYEVIYALKAEDFDLILMDLQMPVFNGFETIEFIRRNFSYPKNIVPVVAMSGRDYASELNQTYKDEGFDGVIEKPFSLDRLDTVIKDILRKAKTPAKDKKLV